MSRPEAAKAGGIIRRELLCSAGMLTRSRLPLQRFSVDIAGLVAQVALVPFALNAAVTGGVVRLMLFGSAGMCSRSRFPLNRFPLCVAGLVALAALVPAALIAAVAGGVIRLVPFCAGGVLSDSAFITGTYKHLRVSHCIAAPAAILT